MNFLNLVTYLIRASHQHFDWETSLGNPYNYFVYGVAVSEVEIDCLTGDHQVLRTDIVIDVGDSLNPAVDIGQVVKNLICHLFCKQ